MSNMRLRLELNVEYYAETTTHNKEEGRYQLDRLVQYAISEGLITNDSYLEELEGVEC